MRGKSEKVKLWNGQLQTQKAFIEKIYERVKNGQLQESTFKITAWEEINKDLLEMTQTNYGVDKLKSKFNRLRQMHRDFSTLLAHIGVTWEMESNKVNASNEVWDELIKKRNHYKNFKKHGFEYDYDILGDIFNSNTATGKLSHASTQEPPNSDEERDMEGDFLTKGIHINVSDDEKDDRKGLGHERKEIFSSGEHRYKEGKTSNKEMLDKIVSIWSDSMSQRTATSRAREERYKGKATQATSPISDPCSAKACMELLGSIGSHFSLL